MPSACCPVIGEQVVPVVREPEGGAAATRITPAPRSSNSVRRWCPNLDAAMKRTSNPYLWAAMASLTSLGIASGLNPTKTYILRWSGEPVSGSGSLTASNCKAWSSVTNATAAPLVNSSAVAVMLTPVRQLPMFNIGMMPVTRQPDSTASAAICVAKANPSGSPGFTAKERLAPWNFLRRGLISLRWSAVIVRHWTCFWSSTLASRSLSVAWLAAASSRLNWRSCSSLRSPTLLPKYYAPRAATNVRNSNITPAISNVVFHPSIETCINA
jgi:hypothetical protein